MTSPEGIERLANQSAIASSRADSDIEILPRCRLFWRCRCIRGRPHYLTRMALMWLLRMPPKVLTVRRPLGAVKMGCLFVLYCRPSAADAHGPGRRALPLRHPPAGPAGAISWTWQNGRWSVCSHAKQSNPASFSNALNSRAERSLPTEDIPCPVGEIVLSQGAFASKSFR